MNALADATLRLSDRLRDLEFPAPVACVYRPLDYAWEPHLEFLKRFGNGRKRVVFLGMNPGPYGMTQTGVPFGEIAAVRDWLEISKPVGRPVVQHPKRPIDGFACKRSEVSGRRLWGLFQDRFGEPGAFFENHFVINYCPLVWMTETGANLTPDKISSAAMAPVEAACAAHLREALDLLRPDFLVGIGAFAEQRLRRSAASGTIGRILHPSPASPLANRGWPEAATRQLEEMGVW